MSSLQVIENLIQVERQKEEDQLRDLSNIVNLVKGLEQKVDDRFDQIVNDSHYKIITMNDIKSLTGFGETYIRERMAEGTFPKPKKFGRESRWYKKDVEKWIRENMENLNDD